MVLSDQKLVLCSWSDPEKWEGPYLNRNLVFEGKEYQVVRTNKGYFITPGEGVTLPNGTTIGKDIVLNETSDIAAMSQDKQPLNYNHQALAVPIQVGAQSNEQTSDAIIPEELAQAQQAWLSGQATGAKA